MSPYTWYVLALLLTAYTFSWMDRFVFAILLEPIKRDLHLSDTVLGLIAGFAFALVYSLAGIPIARLADQGVRRSIIACGLALWSAMTFTSGLCQNGIQLIMARLGIGIGESACGPSAHSLISDYFPRDKRVIALSIFQLGITFGIALGLAVGGWVEERYGWRAAFMIVGFPGLLLAVLMRLTVREPIRGHLDGAGADTVRHSLHAAARIFTERRSFLLYALALGLWSFSDTAFEVWSPTYLMRVYHMGTATVGSRTGAMELVAGIIGTLSSGIIAARLVTHDVRWYLWAPVVWVVVMVLCALAFLTLGVRVAFPSYFLMNLMAAAYMGPIIALTQILMPVRTRALAASVQFLILNLLGPGAGVSFVGIMNDALAPRLGEAAIRYSLMVALLAAGLGVALALIAARHVQKDLQQAGAAQAPDCISTAFPSDVR